MDVCVILIGYRRNGHVALQVGKGEDVWVLKRTCGRAIVWAVVVNMVEYGSVRRITVAEYFSDRIRLSCHEHSEVDSACSLEFREGCFAEPCITACVQCGIRAYNKYGSGREYELRCFICCVRTACAVSVPLPTLTYDLSAIKRRNFTQGVDFLVVHAVVGMRLFHPICGPLDGRCTVLRVVFVRHRRWICSGVRAVFKRLLRNVSLRGGTLRMTVEMNA